MSRNLDVYLHDIHAGTLSQDDSGLLNFRYKDDYQSQRDRPAISHAMPVAPVVYGDSFARPYFSGLLPDEGARRRLARALGVSEGNAFGLLEIIGGECAGALSLLPPGQLPPADDRQGPEPLSEGRLVQVLEELRARPLLGGEEGVRLSLAGAQDKLAVCLQDETVALARGGRPTTHILKPFITALDGTVENELFCMRLAKEMVLPAPAVSMHRAGDIPYLLVERYDRMISRGGAIMRLHQEDFCQALRVPPELKYEEEGGPGAEASMTLIAEATAKPAADRLAFIRMLMFHYLVGNADAHAKNFALLYRNRAPDLAPLYDVVCTAAYRSLSKKLAMAIGGRSVPDTIQLEHWLALVPRTRAAARLLTEDLATMAEAIRPAADTLLTQLKHDGIRHEILTSVRKVIEVRARHLLNITRAANR